MRNLAWLLFFAIGQLVAREVNLTPRQKAADVLRLYDWPGNNRALERLETIISHKDLCAYFKYVNLDGTEVVMAKRRALELATKMDCPRDGAFLRRSIEILPAEHLNVVYFLAVLKYAGKMSSKEKSAVRPAIDELYRRYSSVAEVKKRYSKFIAD